MTAMLPFPFQAALSAFVFLALTDLSRAALPQEQPAQQSSQLDALIAQALEHSPTLPAARHRLEAAKLAAEPSFALPDPSLELSSQAMKLPISKAGSTLALEYRQDLPYPGKRAARKALAESETRLQAAKFEEVRAELVLSVREIYAQLYSTDKSLAALIAGEQLLTMLRKTAVERYSVGQNGREALLKLNVQVAAIQRRQLAVQADRSSLLFQLNRLTGRDDRASLEQVQSLPGTNVMATERLQPSSPELARKTREVESASLRLEAAKKEENPDFMVGGGIGTSGTLEPLLMLRLGMQLPIFGDSKQKLLTQAAASEHRAAVAELEDTRSKLKAQALQTIAAWQKADAWSRSLAATILDSRAALDAALSAFAVGQADFSTVIEDFSLWLEAGIELSLTEADRFQAWARLQYLLPGELPQAEVLQ